MDLSDSLFRNKTAPKYLKCLNYVALSPIISWPLVALASVMLFDHPDNILVTFVIAGLIISYPIPIILLSLLSYKLYPRYKVAAVAIPCAIILGCVSPFVLW